MAFIFIIYLDVQQVICTLIEYRDSQTSNNNEKLKEIIEQLFITLPSLKRVCERALFVLRTERDLKTLMKQFSFVVLHYLLNILLAAHINISIL